MKLYLNLLLLLLVPLLNLLIVQQQRHDLLGLQVPALALEASALDDHLLDGGLLLGPLQDPLLDGALADEAVDGHLLRLAQAVSSVHGLLVDRWVPVAVVEDDLKQSGH